MSAAQNTALLFPDELPPLLESAVAIVLLHLEAFSPADQRRLLDGFDCLLGLDPDLGPDDDPVTGQGPLTDKERKHLAAVFEEKTPAELIYTLLIVHDAVQDLSFGPGHRLALIERMLLRRALTLANVEGLDSEDGELHFIGDALALYMEQEPPEDESTVDALISRLLSDDE